MSLKKDLNDLQKKAVAQGWEITLRKNSGHYKWIAPSGKFVFTSSTPSDWRAIHKIIKDLRSNGFKVE